MKALFLEFVPSASQGLLTLLSVWWPLGQLIGSLGKIRMNEGGLGTLAYMTFSGLGLFDEL